MLNRLCCIWATLVAASIIWTIEGKLVDLSHDHSQNTFMSTLQIPKYAVQPLFDGELLPGVSARWNSYSIGEHGGTHVDAPNHFSKTGYDLKEIPLENTIAEGVMIDCTEEVAKDEDYVLDLKKIQDWEKENGEIPQKAAVVINFNWSHRFNDSLLYFNTNDYSNASSFRYPVPNAAAINFLVDERDINMLAVDTMGPDLMTSSFPVHVKMLTNNRMIVENLKDPGRLPARGFRFHASPVKFVGATGVQVRAYAILGDSYTGSGSHPMSSIVFVITAAIMVYCVS